MFIRVGFEIAAENAVKVPLFLALSPHSPFGGRVIGADRVRADPEVPMEDSSAAF